MPRLYTSNTDGNQPQVARQPDKRDIRRKANLFKAVAGWIPRKDREKPFPEWVPLPSPSPPPLLQQLLRRAGQRNCDDGEDSHG
jgi:hypothetical protein